MLRCPVQRPACDSTIGRSLGQSVNLATYSSQVTCLPEEAALRGRLLQREDVERGGGSQEGDVSLLVSLCPFPSS